MFRTPLYHAYLLQMENYELARYLRVIWRTDGRTQREQRKELQWTPKLAATAALAWGIAVACSAIVAFSAYRGASVAIAILVGAAVLLVACRLFFIFLAVATLAFLPLDRFLKRRLVRRAAAKIRAHPHLRIVGIAGSYGKTTTKELVAASLAQRLRVVRTPENVNTLLGVAEVILRDITPDTEVFVVEMGEHYPGDIRDLCRLAPPDIGIVTGIAESHLERFGSLDRLVAAIFELAEHAKPGATVLLNADSPLITERYVSQGGARAVEWYGVRNAARSPWAAQDYLFYDDGSGQEFELAENGVSRGHYRTALLGSYIMGTATAAIATVRHMDIGDDDVRAALGALPPVPHRLAVIKAPGGAIVIDDSYNGNPEGVTEAIAVLARFGRRRKLYLTPGLVETGERTEAVHCEIGRKLARVADLVILIQTSVTPFIAMGLTEEGFPEERIKGFPSAAAAHAALGEIVAPNDVILFQNDWTDNYV